MKQNDDELITPDTKHITYETYLKVNQMLDLQQPLSAPEHHDETLFIIIHQVYELWFKQILHEIKDCQRALQGGELAQFVRTLRRVNTIQSTLTNQVAILETMTPNDFNKFRERLNPASGFQSMQFRLLEFLLGAKDPSYLKYHRATPQNHDRLEKALAEPTLYDHFLHCLSQRGFKLPDEVLRRDVREAYQYNEGVMQQMLKVYQDPHIDYPVYVALECLMDLDEGFLLWRYRHIAMVERMIGMRRGTGGSTGAKYLATTLAKRFFPEIWEVRNHLGTSEYGARPNG